MDKFHRGAARLGLPLRFGASNDKLFSLGQGLCYMFDESV